MPTHDAACGIARDLIFTSFECGPLHVSYRDRILEHNGRGRSLPMSCCCNNNTASLQPTSGEDGLRGTNEKRRDECGSLGVCDGRTAGREGKAGKVARVGSGQVTMIPG